MRNRLVDFIRALPPAQKAGMVAALVVVAMLSVVFGRWVTTPSYTVLFSGLDGKAVAQVIDELETRGVPYKLEGGGSTVLVPREQLYTTRAAMAGAGVSGGSAGPLGYELLDDQGLTVSDFRQRVDYQRALEGELARTLTAMDGVEAATVRLVLPEEQLFSEQEHPVTASVLLSTRRELTPEEVETVAFLMSSSVEGLEPHNLTVADARGTVLHAPGEDGGSGGGTAATNRHLRQTREFERLLAEDVTRLLQRFGGGPASVVVRAELDFDQAETQTETYGPGQGVTLREQQSTETFSGEGTTPPGGVVGVDGGPEAQAGEGTSSEYDAQETIREYGVDKTVARTVAAPGKVEQLSVAIVMDDGSITGATVPPTDQVARLVSAALGLDAERGDTVEVQTVAFPPVEEPALPEESGTSMVDLVTQIVAVVVLLLVSLALFLMTRRRRKGQTEPAAAMLPAPAPAPPAEPGPQVEPSFADMEAPTIADDTLQRDVAQLVERQPEEIAMLLRGWLADRRS